MEAKSLLKVSSGVLLSQCAFFLALVLDTAHLAKVGTDSLAAWALVQPYWLTVFLFGNGCLIVLDSVFSRVLKDSASQDTKAVWNAQILAGFTLAIMLGLISTVFLFAIAPSLLPRREADFLLLMSTSFLTWFPFIIVRQALVAQERIGLLNVISVGGLIAHAFFLSLFSFAEVVPLAHFLDRILILVLFIPTFLRILGNYKGSIKNIFFLTFNNFRLGVPYALQLVTRSIVFVILATSLRAFGESTLAAQSVLTSLGNLLVLLPFSISITAAVLTARSEARTIVALTQRLLGIGTILTWATLGLVLLFEESILTLFAQDSEVTPYLLRTFPFLLLFLGIDAFQTVLTGIYRGMGRTLEPFVFYALCFFGLALPLPSLLRSWEFDPLASVWLALSLASLALGLILGLRLNGKKKIEEVSCLSTA